MSGLNAFILHEGDGRRMTVFVHEGRLIVEVEAEGQSAHGNLNAVDARSFAVAVGALAQRCHSPREREQ